MLSRGKIFVLRSLLYFYSTSTLLHHVLTEKIDGNALSQKMIVNIFQLENFVDKATLNFHKD